MGYRVSYCEVVEDLSLTHRLTALARREKKRKRERERQRESEYILHNTLLHY